MGVSYSSTITASGGTAPYTYAVSSGSLPTGLSLSSGGSLTGTPSAGGTFPFTVQATDALSFTGSRNYSITVSTSSLDLTVPTVYINQATQNLSFDVPLVANRDGYLRAFGIANQSNSSTPTVRVRIYNGSNSLLQTYTISAPGASVPTSTNESSLTSSWNQLVPGSLLQPGYKLLVDVDPDNAVSELDDANNSWPASGTAQTLDVRDLPELNMTLVPVTTGSGTGNVTVGNAASFMDYTRRIQPIPDYDVQVRAAMNSSATLTSGGGGWDTVLNDVTAQRTADGSSRHYYGIVHVTYSSGVAGLGWIGYPVAIGWDYLSSGSWVMAHEIGHNWDYGHTLCSGGESGTDPGYPYAGGAIGVYGYDLWSSTQKDKTTYKDVMSYCDPQWISDYTYKKILTYRVSDPTFQGQGAHESAARETCLMIWGLERGDEMTLEPSISLETRPSLPAPGLDRVQGLDASGREVFSQSFVLMQATEQLDPPVAGFCFALPLSISMADRIETIRVIRAGQERVRSGPAKPGTGAMFRSTPIDASVTRLGADAVELVWDSAVAPIAMIRDLERNECLGFARNGYAQFVTAARRLEFSFSDGVHTRVQRWPAE